MLRKLAVFILSAGLTMSPLSVQALGFGGIKLKSSLNEKLDAEVALISATASDVQSLTIKLATEEAFLRSGIDRTALLNKLNFKVKQRDDEYYIHVTTSESVREPFMNFLMELNWKNGRMLREYTMLIDPPRSSSKQFAAPAPVVAETDAAEPETITEAAVKESSPFVEPVAEPEPMVMAEEPVMSEPEPEAEPVQQTETIEPEPTLISEPEPALETEPMAVTEPEPMPAVEEPAPEEQLADDADFKPEVFDPETAFVDDGSDELWPRIPLTAYSESADSTEVGELGDLDYGITKANDNLWDIAEKLRQGDNSVSVYQVMMALLKNNPDAFIDNNVHRLKVGHVLRIDDPSALTAISRKEAADAFIAQTKTWNSSRQQAAASTEVQPIMAGGETAAEETVSTDTTGELTLAAPDGQSLTAGGGGNEESLNNDLATMQDQLRQAKSDAGTMRTRNVALNDKLKSLEEELNRLQRSISVKDDELAALQQQLSSLNKEPVKPPVKEEPQAAAPAEPAQMETPAVAAPEVVPPAAPVVEEKPVVAEEKPAVAEEQKEAAKPAKSPVEIASEVSKQENVAAEPGIMDTIMGVLGSIVATVTGIVTGLNLGGDSLLFIVAPIALVVLVIAVILIRRKRKGDNFQESILTGAATVAAGEADAAGDSTTFSEESSFLSDFAMSGASAIEADDSEVDPLTEADVFMAYGRYEAAEERLNEAVQNEPDRMELRAKLIELHHATQNKEAFESTAEDFYASLGGSEADNPLWAKVVSMGTEIAPENPLFSQGGGNADADIPATAETPALDDPGMGMTDSQVMDIGLETGVFEAADLSGSQEAATDDMDFNLDLGESATTEEPAAEPEMDFNLDIGGDLAEAPAEEPVADLDFNLDMGTTESEPEAATEDASLDFNLDIGGGDAPAEEAADLDFNLDMGTEDTAEVGDSGGLDFDLDIGGGETETADASLDFETASTEDAGSLDLNLDASDTADADLGGGDEVGTKLDLAKAYIDMGDPEGARSILDEVMDEGSSTQKEEAQSLLGQIA